MSESKIRVLIIDDSAFARKVIREVLERDSSIEVVGIARDGIEGLEKIAELRPDVITLDLVMPDLDGLGVLRALPGDSPPRVVVVSVSGSDTELAIEALQLGATELVTKPTPLPTDRLYDLSPALIEKVKAAAVARVRRSAKVSSETIAVPLRADAEAVATKLVVIGTSTGGPQALTRLLNDLPGAMPAPIAIALHIPVGYTSAMAARINETSALEVAEARDGMLLQPGQAVIAPGGMHLRVEAQGDQLIANLSSEPRDSIHHPSVDILFESASVQVGSGTLGLIMTGMGSDGFQGAQAIRRAGGRVLAESEESCIVYGMPRTVIEAKLANAEAVLGKLPKLLIDSIYGSDCKE